MPVTRIAISIPLLLTAGLVSGDEPSFDCIRVDPGSIEQMVCEDEELARLDRQLAETYTAARTKPDASQSANLQAEQRGWIKGRDDCWKAVAPRLCVATEYQLRIAELQARYDLVEGIGPIHYRCDGNDDRPVIVHYFHTEPPTARAQLGDERAILYRQPTASGAKYTGRNISLWEHHGEATIVWGYRAAERHCRVEHSETKPE